MQCGHLFSQGTFFYWSSSAAFRGTNKKNWLAWQYNNSPIAIDPSHLSQGNQLSLQLALIKPKGVPPVCEHYILFYVHLLLIAILKSPVVWLQLVYCRSNVQIIIGLYSLTIFFNNFFNSFILWATGFTCQWKCGHFWATLWRHGSIHM